MFGGTNFSEFFSLHRFLEILMRLYGHVRIICIATSLAMTFSMIFSSQAFADGTTDTPPVAKETSLPPVEEPVTEEVTPPAEPDPKLEENNTVSELLSQIPENTGLIVAVEDRVVPLTTPEAAAAIVQGDPIWCPDGAMPNPLANGCTDSYSDLESLIDDFGNSVLPEPNQNGTIWIMSGTDTSSTALVIDGSIFTTWSTYSLTLQGGWDGTGSGNITNSSSFSVPLSVINWGNQVTVSHISIDGTNSTGLEVDTDGDITLEDVSSSNTNGYGTILYSSTGSVTLQGNNSFNNNANSGLYAEASNDINAENLTANNNGTYGAEIYSSNNATLNGVNTFDGNTESGLYVETGQDIYVNNVTAINNGNNGAELNSNNDIYAQNLTAQANNGTGAELYASSNVTMNGTNQFNNNGLSGVLIEADNSIFTDNIASSGNGEHGAELYSLGQVNIAGTNLFTNNNSDGVYIDADGNLYVQNTNATGNGSSGIYVASSASADITCGTLSGNAGYEIEAELDGTLTLNGVDFGGDTGELGVDASLVILNSNGCYNYNNLPEGEQDGSGNIAPPLLSTSSQRIQTVNGSDGQAANLDCDKYQGTLLTLSNGDGAYIPCPIVDLARIFGLQTEDLPHAVPQEYGFVSSFVLTILKNGEALGPLDIPDSIMYITPQDEGLGIQIVYWNGREWINATDQITPFMNVFFKIPNELQGKDLALLYWDGTQWIELAERRNLGNGYVVRTGGHVSEDGLYFEATLNFTGTFILVEK